MAQATENLIADALLIDVSCLFGHTLGGWKSEMLRYGLSMRCLKILIFKMARYEGMFIFNK